MRKATQLETNLAKNSTKSHENERKFTYEIARMIGFALNLEERKIFGNFSALMDSIVFCFCTSYILFITEKYIFK